MPEVRDRLVGLGIRDSLLAFGGRSEVYAAGRAMRGNQARIQPNAVFHDENVPPDGLRSRRNTAAGSPLPSWYPRTPLRDITAIVNAIGLRRERQRAITELQRRNQRTMPSPTTPLLLTSPSSEERSSSDELHGPGISSFHALDPSPDRKFEAKSSPEPGHKTTHGSASAIGDFKQCATGKKCSDFEEFERILSQNLQKKIMEMQNKNKDKAEKNKLMLMR